MRDKNGIINERRAGKSSGFGSSRRRRRGHVLVNAFSRQEVSGGRREYLSAAVSLPDAQSEK